LNPSPYELRMAFCWNRDFHEFVDISRVTKSFKIYVQIKPCSLILNSRLRFKCLPVFLTFIAGTFEWISEGQINFELGKFFILSKFGCYNRWHYRGPSVIVKRNKSWIQNRVPAFYNWIFWLLRSVFYLYRMDFLFIEYFLQSRPRLFFTAGYSMTTNFINRRILLWSRRVCVCH
jgi:hypothetical protein